MIEWKPLSLNEGVNPIDKKVDPLDLGLGPVLHWIHSFIDRKIPR
jgi:hypothetical protein